MDRQGRFDCEGLITCCAEGLCYSEVHNESWLVYNQEENNVILNFIPFDGLTRIEIWDQRGEAHIIKTHRCFFMTGEGNLGNHLLTYFDNDGTFIKNLVN